MTVDNLIKNSHPGINEIRLRDLLAIRENSVTTHLLDLFSLRSEWEVSR